MRIAVVSQMNSPGGGSRFLRALVLGLLEHPDRVERIGLFADAAAVHRDGLVELLSGSDRVDLFKVDAWGRMAHGDGTPEPPQATPSFGERATGFLRRRVLRLPEPVRPLPQVTLSDEVVGELSAFDVAYFAWPRLIAPPEIGCPLVATFHDFNHRHSFGNFTTQDVRALDEELSTWLRGETYPVSSTRFIAGELDSYYPFRRHAPSVVYLSTFALHEPTPSEVEEVRGRHGIGERYMVCPTNISPHKNVKRLFEAAGMLKRSGKGIPLVLTGSGTQTLGSDPSGDPLYQTLYRPFIDEENEAADAAGLRRGEDLIALGYVSDADMDALIQGATLVVAPSLYEAGSGPALDAWQLGVPVASSSIPPVLEQIRFLGTEATLFDAERPDTIAEAIARILEGPEEAKAMTDRSRDAMAAYGWDDVAAGYLDVFEAAIAGGRGVDGRS